MILRNEAAVSKPFGGDMGRIVGGQFRRPALTKPVDIDQLTALMRVWLPSA